VQRRVQRGIDERPTSDDTLGAVLGRYWLDHASHMRSGETTQFHLKRLAERLDTAADVGALTNDDLARYVAVRRLEVAPATVNRELACLRSVLGMAAELWGHRVPVLAWGRLRLPEPRERVRHITATDARRLCDALPAHLVSAVIWSLLTGCRKFETFGLTWDRVHLLQRTVTVFAKGGRSDAIDLSADAVRLLETIRDNIVDPDAPVFDATNLRRHWRHACAAVGLADFRWHDLRHTHATWLRQDGTAIEIVQRSLRHRDIGTTMRYAHVGREEVRAAVSRIQIGAE
jgi:integrase